MNPEIHEAIPDTTTTTTTTMDTELTTEPEEEILYSKINTRIIDLEKGWRDIAWGIVKFLKILEGLPEPPFDADDHMLIYDTVYNMCYQRPPHDHSEQLYDRYHDSILVYCAEVVLPSLEDKEGELMLSELVRRWDNHKVLVKWLSVFFGILNRYYVEKADVPRIEDVGLFVFRDGLFRNVGCYARAVVMSLIEAEREGGKIDRALLRRVVDVFVAMGNGKICIYENDFEKLMIRETGEYYSRRAANWVVEDSLVEYLFRADECLRREKERVSHYLHSSSEGKLLEKVHHELVVVYAQQLLDKDYGFSALLRDNKLEDLSMVYRLYSRTAKELELVVSAFKKQLFNEGKALVQQAEEGASSQGSSNAAVGEHGVELIRKIIEMNEKYKGCVEGGFMKNSLFQKALREAFEVFCNMPVCGNSSAELLAEFCNSILKKKGGYQLSDEEIDETFENVVKVFAYFNDKDLFAEYCRKKLARRLLFDHGSCDDHEKSLLAKLKQHCGGQFTTKMEGMITDLTLSKDTQINFENFLDFNPHVKPGIDFTVTVLTTGYWPTYKSADLNLPEEMVKCVEVFKGFFETEKKHRKLQWIYSLGTCTVIGKFERKTMELVVSTSQAALLLLFNYADRLSFSEISTQSNLTDEDLVRLLHSLSCAKYKILVKEPNTKTISPNDVFMFNSKFTDKMRRIKIPLPPVDERKKVIEDVDKDRRHAIDAAVVRIMKSRKVMSHQDLVMESVEQLHSMFKPDIKTIKKRIEDLITREYLERDEEDPTKFKYLA